MYVSHQSRRLACLFHHTRPSPCIFHHARISRYRFRQTRIPPMPMPSHQTIPMPFPSLQALPPRFPSYQIVPMPFLPPALTPFLLLSSVFLFLLPPYRGDFSSPRLVQRLQAPNPVSWEGGPRQAASPNELPAADHMEGNVGRVNCSPTRQARRTGALVEMATSGPQSGSYHW